MYKTIESINKEFNGQWVFMINCEKDDNGTVVGGEVVIHSESRDKVIRGMNTSWKKVILTLDMQEKYQKKLALYYEQM